MIMPRGAKTALQAVAFPEAFLNGVQFAVLSQPLNGGDFSTVGLHCQNRTRFDGLAIEHHAARATQAGFAAYMGAGQADDFAQEVDEQHPGFDVVALTLSVDCDFNFHERASFEKG